MRPRVMIRKIGKYELLEELGHGGMATVYRAIDTLLKRDVAIKIMHPHLRGAAQARARFAREAQSVARIKHPHILEIYDFSGEDSDEAYIVTELLTGPTLRKFIEDHQDIPAEVVAAFGIDIARALDAAHGSGIIHRDVKPENVILHENRIAKLTDFGIAQMVDAQGMTATGQVIGSPGHMAPEQVEGKECDARSDLFSLGTVLYALATGKPAFPGNNPHQILRRIMEGEFVDPLRLNPALGGRMRSIITRLLEREPERRYATAKEVETELSAFLQEMKVDDADAILARYLNDPETFIASHRVHVIARLIELGEQALTKKQRLVALDYLNRVLALDDGNEKVLALVARARRGARPQRVLIYASVGLVGFGLIAIACAMWLMRHPHDVQKTPSEEMVNVVRDPALSLWDAAAPLAFADAAVSFDVDAARPFARDASAPIAVVIARPVVRPEPLASSRQVEFAPTPQGVMISVDGAPAQEFGPAFRMITLDTGRHTVSYSGDELFLYRTSIAFDVPPGTGVFRVRHRIPFRAALRISCRNGEEGVAGTVRVGSLSGSYRCGRLETIPIEERRATLPVVVEAAGFRSYRGQVVLEASSTVTELIARLTPVADSPPP